jgi:peptide/nickel transport system substrate-binding protein
MGWTNGFGEVTADDVKFSYERMADPANKSPYRGDWAALDRVDVTSSHTGVIVLKEPFIPLFTTTLPFNSSSIVSRKAVEKLDGQRFTLEPPATFGPYRIKTNIARQRITLERNRDWPGRAPAFDEVDFINILDANAAETAYAAGEIDLTLLPMTAVPRVQKAMPARSRLVVAPSLAYWWLGMQMEAGTFADKRVRQAVQLAVDPQAMLEGAFFGVPPRSTGFIAPGMVGHRPANRIAKPDLARARQLLAEAGHPRGFKTEIGVRNSAEFVNAAQVVAASLAQVGIEATVQPFDQGVQKALAGGDWRKMQLHITRFSMQPDPSWASVWFTREQIGEWNWERFADAEYNDLHKAALREADPQKRHAMYVRMQDIMEDSGAYVFLTHGVNPILHRDHFVPALTPDANRVLVTKFRLA